MTTSIQVLLAGESWISQSTHIKGWDFFSSADYQTGIEYLEPALVDAGITFTHLPNHLAAAQFPSTQEELSRYDVVILSDIGANTLLLHPDTWLHGRPHPNRLRLIADWVRDGGGLVMCGGYYSFQGIYGAARYRGTQVEEVLPVTILPVDDRVEIPEGETPEVVVHHHPIVSGIDGAWPYLLGCNEVMLKADAQLAQPLADTRSSPRGRSDRAVPWSGHWILAHTGVRRSSLPGTATRSCGSRCCNG